MATVNLKVYGDMCERLIAACREREVEMTREYYSKGSFSIGDYTELVRFESALSQMMVGRRDGFENCSLESVRFFEIDALVHCFVEIQSWIYDVYDSVILSVFSDTDYVGLVNSIYEHYGMSLRKEREERNDTVRHAELVKTGEIASERKKRYGI